MEKKKRVLIVDDEEEIVTFMARFLKRLDIDSVTAISGEQALQLYDADKFDCVFLDVHLGGISGIAVLARLKQINPSVKVIIITGSISSDNKSNVLELGATDYIAKPIDLAELKEKIATYL